MNRFNVSRVSFCCITGNVLFQGNQQKYASKIKKNGKIWYANSFYNKFKISSGIVIISAYYGVNRQINSSIMNWIVKKFI